MWLPPNRGHRIGNHFLGASAPHDWRKLICNLTFNPEALRKHQERSIESLWKRIGKLLNSFTPAECRNFFHHAGYA